MNPRPNRSLAEPGSAPSIRSPLAIGIGLALCRIGLIASIGCAAAISAAAHESKAGAVTIEHAYATPTLAGTSTGAAYIATLENTGDQPDRLVRASTPVAARVELHTMTVDAQGVMRMREADGVLAPHTPIKMRPGMGMHLMLIDMKRPLKEGDTFPMTMEFERGGKVDVKVVVQVYKPRAADTAMQGTSMPRHDMPEHKH